MDRADVYRSTVRHLFAPVADLLYDDDTVTEVLINGPNQIYCERRGRLEKVDRRFPDEHALLAAARNLAEYVRRRLDDKHHSMDARLPDPEKFRVHVVLPRVVSGMRVDPQVPAGRHRTGVGRSPSATCSSIPCACGPTASSSARSAAARRWI